MKPDITQATKALEALFRTYPGFRPDDLGATVKTYLHAVSIYETVDVMQGISDFITGNVPGHNPAYAPSAPQVGSAVRQAMERRAEAARIERLSLPVAADDSWQNPAPEIRQLNKNVLSKLVDDLAEADPSAPTEKDKAEATKKIEEQWVRTNKRFQPDMSPDAMIKRLGLQSIAKKPPRDESGGNSNGEAA